MTEKYEQQNIYKKKKFSVSQIIKTFKWYLTDFVA